MHPWLPPPQQPAGTGLLDAPLPRRVILSGAVGGVELRRSGDAVSIDGISAEIERRASEASLSREVAPKATEGVFVCIRTPPPAPREPPHRGGHPVRRFHGA